MKKYHLLFFILLINLFYAKEKIKLSDFKFNIYSQWGEDGIIQKIFEIIKPENKICVEFGAADGFMCSNTANLWKNRGWSALLIEPDPKSYQTLKKNISGYNCQIINKYVNITDNKLDNLFENLNLTKNVDLLSIDIDGNDYHIFNSIQKINARVVICEYNPTIPFFLDIYQDYENQNFGASIGALKRIAKTKDLFLAAVTETNCIFIQNKYKEMFKEYEFKTKKIQEKRFLKYLMFDMIGRPLIIGETLDKHYDTQLSGTNVNIFNKNKKNQARIVINRWQISQ